MKKRITINIIEEMIKKLPGYVLVTKEYTGYYDDIKIICDKGHKYKTKYAHIKNGCICKKCMINNKKLTIDDINQRLSDFGYKLLSKTYVNANKLIKIECPVGHVYNVTYGNFYNGKRCPVCNKHNGISKQEKDIHNYIKSIYDGIVKPNDRTIIRNPKTGHFLELDIWLPEIKKAIEYNGIYWHKEKETKNRDDFKVDFCNKHNISLLVVDHDEWIKNNNFDKIKNFIYGK